MPGHEGSDVRAYQRGARDPSTEGSWLDSAQSTAHLLRLVNFWASLRIQLKLHLL